MVVEGYDGFGGCHDETAAVRNVLASQGVTAPHTGEPFSEAMLFGIGGGLGGGYHVFQYGDESTFFLGVRAFWDQPDAGMARRIVERLGGELRVRETSGATKGAEQLLEPLAEGSPVLVWLDPGGLPYLGHDGSQYIFHVVTACGRDAESGEVLLDDLAPAPWRVAKDDLAEARAMVPSLKHRTAVVVPPAEAPALEPAVRAGLEDCVAELTSPRRPNMGIDAFEKWSGLLAGSKAKKSWARAFAPGPNLWRALRGIHYWIESAETGAGGALRDLHADFLAEAAELSGNSGLEAAAESYRRLAASWSALADRALPDEVEPLARAKQLLTRKRRLVAERGADAADEVRRAAAELRELTADLGDSFPLTAEEAETLREELKERLVEIVSAERDAASELSEAIG